MALSIGPEIRERVPLIQGAGDAVLVRGTRVPLDVVVSACAEGKSAEEIALAYPTLTLADIYAVLSYYLRHRDQVDAYVADRRQEAEALRARIQASTDTSGIRERLLARKRH